MKKKDGSFVVLFKDDLRKEVFLVYRSDWPLWNLTGGGIEPGENPKDTAIREAFEETGFKIKISRKVGVYDTHDPETDTRVNIIHLFEGRVVSGKFCPEFPGCRGQWFNTNHLPIDITDKTRIRILDAANYKQKEFFKQTYSSRLKDNLHLLIHHPIAALRYFRRK